MVLPVILSMLGSAAAGAGMLGTMSPLLAGAIGSGLGTLAQGGSAGDALKSGVTGYGIGWGMGKAGQALGMGDPVTGASLAFDPATGAAVESMGVPVTGAGGLSFPGGSPVTGGMPPPPVPAGAVPSDGMMSKYLTSTATGLNGVPSGGVAEGKFSDRLFAGAIGPNGSRTPAAIGAALGPAMMYPNMPEFDDGKGERAPQSPPTERAYYDAPPDYRPGVDPEHYYFDPYPKPATMYAAQGGQLGYSAPGGGQVPISPGGVADIAAQGTAASASDRDMVTMAYAALRGEVPEEMVGPILMQFVSVHGEDALRSLMAQVEAGGAEAAVSPIGGSGMRQVSGAGATDMIPADMDGQHVLLDDGEVVMPTRAVAGAGGGDLSKGAEALAGLAEILVEQQRVAA
jgi:hypothetical protein